MADTTGNTISGNAIGLAADGHSGLGNTFVGIACVDQCQDNMIGPRNHIAYNSSDGVLVGNAASYGNVITENNIHANGDKGIELLDGNNGILPPDILSTMPGSVIIQGTACSECTVEIFASPTDEGEGQLFLGRVAADLAGQYILEVPGLPYPYLTATAIDAEDGTSEFSAVFRSTVYFVFLPFVVAAH